jgi:hypothetical protein
LLLLLLLLLLLQLLLRLLLLPSPDALEKYFCCTCTVDEKQVSNVGRVSKKELI